jgi:DNA-binding transcriptional regulator YhcF (GntR family)
MDLHADAHSPIPIRRLMAKAPTNVITRGGLPREQAWPSIRARADSPGGDPNAVTRAIEDLKRSEYRALRPRPAALQPSSSPGAPPGPRPTG